MPRPALQCAEHETVTVRVLAAKLQTLRAEESPFPRKAGKSTVTPEMLVAPPEQVSHDRSLASSAIDRGLPLDA